MNNEKVTSFEAAEILGISRESLIQKIRAYKNKPKNISKTTKYMLFYKDDILKFKEQLENETQLSLKCSYFNGLENLLNLSKMFHSRPKISYN